MTDGGEGCAQLFPQYAHYMSWVIMNLRIRTYLLDARIMQSGCTEERAQWIPVQFIIKQTINIRRNYSSNMEKGEIMLWLTQHD